MVNAHDLLWGMTPAHLPADAPAWAVEAMCAAHPVVVRRAIAEPGYVAVGVRGRLREQRFGAEMPLAAVQRRVAPEALRDVVSSRDLPALQALAQLRSVLEQETWGVSGSAGFELATGIEALHARSDLDLILRTPKRLERAHFRKMRAGGFDQGLGTKGQAPQKPPATCGLIEAQEENGQELSDMAFQDVGLKGIKHPEVIRGRIFPRKRAIQRDWHKGSP